MTTCFTKTGSEPWHFHCKTWSYFILQHLSVETSMWGGP